MKLVDVEYAFDNSKLLFYFTADGRVDFRELVEDLAAVFRTRIELRQIGIRDRDEASRRYRYLRQTVLLQDLPVRFRTGVDKDGEGAESLTQFGQDIWCLRKANVLSEI